MKKLIFSLTFFYATLIAFGQTWENVGGGLNNNVYDLQKFNNKLYAAGRMGVKFWDESTWTSLPNPFGISYPLALEVYNDTLYVGGDNLAFSSISHVYKFNGINWVQVGSDFDETIWSATKKLLNYNGQLVSAGHYTSVNAMPINNIASWNGHTWSSLADGLNGGVWNLAEHNGDLFASGEFTASGSDTMVKHIGKWDGTSWSALDTTHFLSSAGPMISFDSLLIIGNVWDTMNGIPMKGIATWNGSTFLSRGNNLIHQVRNFLVHNGELYLCGDIYTLVPSIYSDVVLKWNGYHWEQVGLEFDKPILAIDDFNGDIFCGGFYTTCGTAPTSHVARLDVATGILEVDKQTNFQFYPNPTINNIVFNTTEKGTLTITNQVGQVMATVFIKETQTQIVTDNLETGIYLLTFQSEKQQATSKLVIQR